MRWLRHALNLALLLCSCLSAQQAQVGLDVQGVVIDAVARQPIAGVHITLRAGPAIGPERDNADTYGAISRPDGHFSIADLKPGVYYLVAQHNGYVELPGKKPGAGTITLKPGEVVQDLTVELTQHAVIIGHVLDEFGDPVHHVQVSAESISPGNGNSMATAPTDERGQFRISLPPGKYYVQALADSMRHSAFAEGLPEIRTDGAVPPVYGATFYPAAASSDKATAVELAPGQSLSGIDIHLAPKRSVTIRGTVTGMPANNFGVPAFIMLRSVTSGTPGHGSMSQPAFSQPDGTFVIAGLTPGKYRLTARFNVADAPTMQSASVEVDAQTDETSVGLALAHGETLFGTVEIEGEAPKPAAREKLSVRLNPEIQFGGENKGADVGDNGAFHIDEVFPGKLRVSVMPLPENSYIKSIKAGAAEAQDGMVDLSHGVAGAEIHITLSRNGGRVEGRVLGEDGQAFAGVSLVVLQESIQTLDDKAVKPLEAGEKFSYSGLHPGKYRIIALDPAQFMGGRDGPDALKAPLAHAEEIEIHEGDRITKDIKIMPVESASAKQ